MGTLTYSHSFINGDTGLGAKAQDNFDDITLVINGALDGSNVKTNSMIMIDSIDISGTLNTLAIENPSIAYNMTANFEVNVDNKLEIKNNSSALIFYIDNSKDIYIGS